MARQQLSPDDMNDDKSPSILEEEVDTGEFEVDADPLPSGYFPAKCVAFAKTKSKNGNDQIELKCVIFTEEGNRKAIYWSSLTAAARWKFTQDVAVFDVVPDPDTKKLSIKPEFFVGKIFMVSTGPDTYQGVTRVKILKISPASATIKAKYASTPDEDLD